MIRAMPTHRQAQTDFKIACFGSCVVPQSSWQSYKCSVVERIIKLERLVESGYAWSGKDL